MKIKQGNWKGINQAVTKKLSSKLSLQNWSHMRLMTLVKTMQLNTQTERELTLLINIKIYFKICSKPKLEGEKSKREKGENQLKTQSN